MASVARDDLPAYTLAELPPGPQHVVLTPAVRWRVVVEDVVEIEHDVMLDAVLRIRAAGEKSPARIADLLQLPEDLVRHLLLQAAAAQMQVACDGGVQTRASRVSWIYRDVETGELWPHPAKEVPPLPLRYTAPHRARFDRGTAGRPIPVKCLLMATAQSRTTEPTSMELARFSRASDDPNGRTTLVSSGERCMVASPVVASSVGHAVLTTRGTPHLTLSQRLAQLGQEQESVRRWLAGVPSSSATSRHDLPLRQAIAELQEASSNRDSIFQTHDVVPILSRIELCLSRFVDQFQYSHGIPATSDITADAAIKAGVRDGLSKELVREMTTAERGSLGHKMLRLLHSQPELDQLLLDFIVNAAKFTTISATSVAPQTLESLVDRTIDVCDRLVIASEGTHVKQAE